MTQPNQAPVDLKKVFLVIATPCKNFGPPSHVQSFMHLLSKSGPILGGVAHMTNAARTCAEARGHLVHNFLTEKIGTHLLFVDSDIEYQPETVFEMLRLNLPVVTTGYSGHDSIAPGPYRFNVEMLSQGTPQTEPVDGCLKISASGLGFTLLRYDALLEMTQRYAESLSYDEIHPEGGHLLTRVGLFNEPLVDAAQFGREGLRHWFGEDFIFFYRWRALGPGHDVWLYLNAPLVHHFTTASGFNAKNHLNEILEWDIASKNVLPPTRTWHPEIDGWSSDILPFYRIRARTLPEDARCVEVGVYKGRSMLFLATDLMRHGKGKATVWGVDPGTDWRDDSTMGASGEPEIHKAGRPDLLKHMEAIKDEWGTVKVVSLPETSLEGAKHFEDESLDLVFLDGDHTKESVWRDIKAWWPKVKVGGTLSGHDFQPAFMGVVNAVNDKFAKDPTLQIQGSVWAVKKLSKS